MQVLINRINRPISNTLDYGKGYRSVVDLIEDTCANPNAEDAGANFLSISAKLRDLKIPELDEMDETVQDYTETVCGYEKSQHITDIQDVFGDGEFIIADIPIMLKVIQNIQENSNDWKCKYQICNM